MLSWSFSSFIWNFWRHIPAIHSGFCSFRISRPSSAELTGRVQDSEKCPISAAKVFNRRERIAGGRIFHLNQTYPERRLLLPHHLSGHGFTGGYVPSDARHPAHGRLARTVAGDGHRPGTKSHASTPNLCPPPAPATCQS